jgi:hypothetical protein
MVWGVGTTGGMPAPRCPKCRVGVSLIW